MINDIVGLISTKSRFLAYSYFSFLPIYLNLFSIRVDIERYFILVSGAQNSG